MKDAYVNASICIMTLREEAVYFTYRHLVIDFF